MGRTPTPLTLLIDSEWIDHPMIVSLREKGHTISAFSASADLILSPRAHWWSNEMFSHPTYLAEALKAARARKKGTLHA